MASVIDSATMTSRRAMSFLQEHGLAPTPQNYTLWFTYFAGTDMDLGREVTQIMGRNQPIGEDVCAELYQRFFRSDEEEEMVSDASVTIQREVASLLTTLTEVGSGAESYATRLKSFLKDVGRANDVTAMGGVIRAMVDETREMAARNAELSDQLATSTEKMSQLQKDLETIRREAMTDGLTGINNRRAFEADLRDQSAAANTNRTPLSLIMADIDHFKAFNDTWGHQMGDHVLKLVARVLQESVRGSDLTARYGGEEFVILLPETSLANAVRVAENLRRRISSRTLRHKTTNESLGTITLSLGVAQYDRGEPPEDLVERADGALYTAKQAGRNRVYSNVKEVKSAAQTA